MLPASKGSNSAPMPPGGSGKALARSLADQSRTIRIPVHQTEASNRIPPGVAPPRAAIGTSQPRLEEVASMMRMRPDRLHGNDAGVSGNRWHWSIRSAMAERNSGRTSAGPAGGPPDAHVNRTELTARMDRILGTLTPREQTVIRLRLPGIGEDPSTDARTGGPTSVGHA